jgi:membrane protease YdiL (CAAX protease family)
MADLAPFPPVRPPTSHGQLMLATLVVEGGMLLLALVLARWLDLTWTPPHGIGWTIGLGLAGSLPTIALVPWSLRTAWPPAARLRRLLVEDVAPGLVTGEPWRLVFYSISAGVSEEALFRGVLQVWLASWLGVWPAVVVAGLVFGLFHPASREYVVAAAIIGAWWGALYLLTGDLVAAMIAHALHDVAAMAALRAELARRPG